MKEKKEILNAVYTSLSNGIRAGKSDAARRWMQNKCLSIDLTRACFNSGQLHHRKDQNFIDELLSVDFLKPSSAATNTGQVGYTSFAKEAIVFPLLNSDNSVVNFYGIRINKKADNEEYLNDDGIYPCYPHPLTQRLYVTTSVLDAATLLETRLLENRDAVMALHDGELKTQHLEAMEKLNQLTEIVIIDNANSSITQKLSNLSTKIRTVNLPEDHTLNGMLVHYGVESILQLFNESFDEFTMAVTLKEENQLKEIHKGKLSYPTEIGTYYVLGNISNDLSTLKGTIAFESIGGGRMHRNKMDLYERSHVVNFITSVSEAENISSKQFETELSNLTTLLEKYREGNLGLYIPEKRKSINLLPPEKEREAIAFLSQPNVIDRIDNLIEAYGIVGEENTRKMVFVIASTYKMQNPLHGLIQGISGSGKTHLINSIGELMPPEDVMNITRVTSKSFYHYKEDELIGKLVLIQDIDGLDEEAMYAFREMQSAGFVSSSTIKKDSSGNLQSVIQYVKSKFASLVATTHAEIYFDNLSRSIVLGVDESETQTSRIIQQQNNQHAGLFDTKKANHAKEVIQNCMRVLKPYDVVNKYANLLNLPVDAKMLRRLNGHFQEVIKQVTLLNQFQRKQDDQGRLITTIEDLKLATEIMFDAIMWKVDELDSSLRQFFEQLKKYLLEQEKNKQACFTTREVRQAFNLSSSQVDRFIQLLKRLEYIIVSDGTSNKGYIYKVVFWDDMEKIRQKVKADLMKQIDAIK